MEQVLCMIRFSSVPKLRTFFNAVLDEAAFHSFRYNLRRSSFECHLQRYEEEWYITHQAFRGKDSCDFAMLYNPSTLAEIAQPFMPK